MTWEAAFTVLCWAVISYSAGRILAKHFYRRKDRRNTMGRAKGYSGCLRCGDTWDWKQEHVTEYSAVSWATEGCFPLCQECWEALGTPEARWPFYDRLIDTWECNNGRADLYLAALTGATYCDERRRVIYKAVMDGG